MRSECYGFFLHILCKYGINFIVNIGNYTILENIGHGGMGEVFLVHDPVCKREVALKQMREQWLKNETMKERFIREARIASQLSHPSIIPIYTMDEEGSYYTMPFIEGETLKTILKITREQMKNGDPLHPIGSSVPTLVRIFLNVCGAMGYSHSHGVLHRDLKPDNIIVGKYGEVLIIDWGLADFIDRPEKGEVDVEESDPRLTQPGKIPGTLLYMAPERAFGAGSSVLTDIYSLGVVLYQLLTLQNPFRRGSLKEFKKLFKYEKVHDPEEMAPDRDISPHLSNITKKCLAKDPKKRFQSIEELIKELENYTAGLPEWLDAGKLKVEDKDDWQFQENIALTKHMALTRGIETLEWVNLMVSKAQFPGNLLIETRFALKKGSKGLGILFSIPEMNLQLGAENAYCLWLSTEGIRLFRSNVEVYQNSDLKIEVDREYHLKVENVGNHVRVFLDGVNKFGFLSHIPLPGTRIGIMVRDGDFAINPLNVSVGSQNIMVNCLSIPDAFLARNDFDEALKEYRKISHSFPGRAEGREATYRAGLTLLEKAKTTKAAKEQNALFEEAHAEFEKLHNTPGAPLEYLGKSKIYRAQNDLNDEAKSLELALRKFPNHPLRPILVETILSRMHETSQNQRHGAYYFALIVLRHLSDTPDAAIISGILENHVEPLLFFTKSENLNTHLILRMAFWLNKPLVAFEMLEKGLSGPDAQNAQRSLILLDCEDLTDLSALEIKTFEAQLAKFLYAMKKGALLPREPLPLWSALLDSDWEEAKKIVDEFNPSRFQNAHNLPFTMYGCYLAHVEGEEAAVKHLTNITEMPFPSTPGLLSHYLMGRINLKEGWIEKAFYWEKFILFKELELYYHCLGDKKELKKIREMAKKL